MADLQQLEPDDWQAWFVRHQAALALLARQYVGTPEEAADAVQDGFVRFWRARQRARDPVAYLFSCVRTAALDVRRNTLARQRRQRPDLAADGAGEGRTVAPVLTGPGELEERRKEIEAALAELPEEQRAVLVLKIWSGLTFGQIAAALEIPANTAASRYRYGLERLQVVLTPEVTRE